MYANVSSVPSSSPPLFERSNLEMTGDDSVQLLISSVPSSPPPFKGPKLKKMDADRLPSPISSVPSSSPPLFKKTKLEKTDDDSVPLPDPFPLPKHYPIDIEKELESKKMSVRGKQKFISEIASAMLSYKRYPTRDDYICVARSVVDFFKDI